MHDTLQAWIEKASKWLSYRGLPMVPHVGVLENSFQFGIHAHILMHVPAPMRRAFKQRGRRWLGKDAPAQSITVRGTRYPGLGDDPLRPMKGRLRYILKCIETEAGKLLDIVPKGRDHIVGKRVWVAQCIGPAARAGRLQKRARKTVRTLAGPGGSEGLESVRSTLSSSSTDER